MDIHSEHVLQNSSVTPYIRYFPLRDYDYHYAKNLKIPYENRTPSGSKQLVAAFYRSLGILSELEDKLAGKGGRGRRVV